MSQLFAKGDIVKLKSGGPPMTVQAEGQDSGSDDKVPCIWFDENSLRQHVFDKLILSKIEFSALHSTICSSVSPRSNARMATFANSPETLPSEARSLT